MRPHSAKLNSGADFRLTPIGSCRIAGPLSVAALRFGFELNCSRTYGYSHSSLEAVQHARYLQGDYHASKEIWPLISRRTDFETHKLVKHTKSDVYVVEICSNKQLTFRGHALQLNYLQSQFADFFSSSERSRAYWSELKIGSPKLLLDSIWSGSQRRNERRFLAELQCRVTTDEEIARHLSELKKRFKNLVVVTHVDAKREDGSAIPARSAYISKVKRAAGMLGIPLFDPTPLMMRIGQNEAMINGESLTHYSEKFIERLSEDLFFGPISQALPANKEHVRKRNRKLHNSVISPAEEKPSEPVDCLAGEPLKPQARETEYTYLNADKYHQIARANEYLGKFEKSAELYRTLMMTDCSYEAAISFLQNRQNVTEPMTISGSALRGLVRSVGLETVLDHTTDRNELLGLLGFATSSKEWNRIIGTLLDVTDNAAWLDLLHTVFTQRRLVQFELTLDQKLIDKLCLDAEEFSRPLLELKYLQQIESYVGERRTLSRNIKDARKRAIVQAKINFSTQNVVALSEDYCANSQLFSPVEAINLLFARAKFQNGEYETAAEISLAAANRSPADLTPWIIAMRSAHAIGNLQTARIAAEKIVSLAAKERPRYSQEAASLLKELEAAA